MKKNSATLASLLPTALFPAAIVAAGLLAHSSFADNRYDEKREKREYDLHNIDTLKLDMSHAEITFVNGDNSMLVVELEQTLKRGEPEKCLQVIDSTTSGKSLRVFTKIPDNEGNNNCRVERRTSIVLDQSALKKLKLEHSHGKIIAESLAIAGDLNMDISHSHLKLGRLASTESRLEIRHSDAQISSMAVDQLKLQGGHGNIHIKRSEGSHMDVDWAHGDVIVDSSELAAMKVHQAHGEIELRSHNGESLVLENSHGPIRIKSGTASKVELHNSHGSISYAGASDALEAHNSHGSVNITQNSGNYDRIDIETAHGGIALSVPQGSVCELSRSNVSSVSSHLFKNKEDCVSQQGRGEIRLSSVHGDSSINAY